MNLLNEINSLIKTSQYLKALKLLIRYEYQDSAEICIKIVRRYSYVCNKLLFKYLLKYDKKSHKVKPILYRAFDALYLWSQYLQKEETIHKVFTPKRLSCMSPQASQKIINQRTKVNRKWLFQQKRLFLQSLQDTLKYHYYYLKLRKENTFALLILKKFIVVSYFSDCNFQLHQKSINNRQEMLMIIGSAYFEINSMQQTIDHLYLSIILGLEKTVIPLFYLKEQLRISQSDKQFQKQIMKSTSIIVASISLLAKAHELKGEIQEMQTCISFSKFVCTILIFFEKCFELQKVIESIDNNKLDTYSLYLQENGELIRFAKFLTDYQIQKSSTSFTPRTLQEELLEKRLKIAEQPQVIVSNHHQIEIEETNHFHKKTNSELTDTTLASGRPSKCGTEIQFFNDSLGLTSISIQQPSEFQKYRKFTKVHKYKKSGNNFLAKLLQLSEHNKHEEYQLQAKQIKKESSFRTLEQEINNIIDRRLPRNHVPFEQSQLLCTKLIKQESEQRKEFPFAYDMLKFKQEFGSGLCILEENIQEFNKHFEFNVLMYFDYLTQSKESAMSNLKYNQNFSKLRLAEQKLIQSRNLVLKKQVESIQQEKEEEKKKDTENETQANLLFETVQKRKTMLFNILGANDTPIKTPQTNESKVQKYEKNVFKFPSTNTTPKHNSLTEQIRQFSAQREKQISQQFFNKAQTTIKAQLLESEFLIEQKQNLKNYSEPPELLLTKLGNNDELANSVKHLKASGFQKILLKKRKTTKLASTKL
ncbi:unnamed protein product (macronuclear) [Paramecium tetraurelia]|uniref:Transmembrane protein n=1 Tax=Paramecium tetraurelia TaxID=5888 RepID=A0D2T1_PARTE|nr:uncharacterized protein GSPATT00012856001 [Paramecium tetraurelia]CAK77348.1 unnamed protein product [Paramecium tetraurelia]|eukprot:XP_001444745.1 hypothetical protein (macronuclear) [Paramecium tetraurelia strain d4-2]